MRGAASMVVLDFDTYTLLAQQSALLSKLMPTSSTTHRLASSSTVLQLIELEAKVAEVAQQNENSPAAAAPPRLAAAMAAC